LKVETRLLQHNLSKVVLLLPVKRRIAAPMAIGLKMGLPRR
jgi:hypothetical protein